jgi:hypothetical protein
MAIKTKPFELKPTHDYKTLTDREIDEKRTAHKMGAATWNNNLEHQFHRSFQGTETQREQEQLNNNLPKIKESIKANIEGQIKNLSNKPPHEWTPQESEAFRELSPELQEHITKQNKKRFGF